jgi:alpha-glucosidase
VPLPWSEASASLGFGPGPESWLPQPASWRALTVERQTADPASVLHLYRAALAHRRRTPDLAGGDLTWLPAPDGVLAFRRGAGFVCVVNPGDAPAPLPAEVRSVPPLLTSAPGATGDTLPGATAGWYRTDSAGTS